MEISYAQPAHFPYVENCIWRKRIWAIGSLRQRAAVAAYRGKDELEPTGISTAPNVDQREPIASALDALAAVSIPIGTLSSAAFFAPALSKAVTECSQVLLRVLDGPCPTVRHSKGHMTLPAVVGW